MTAETLLTLYQDLQTKEVKIWIDGGWGVDALLGEQSRQHEDADFVIQEKDLDATVSFLRNSGYEDVPKNDTRAWNFALGLNGNEIDMHIININEDGEGIYGPVENGQAYPAYALDGVGTINGKKVRCISLQYQLESHTGYSIRDKDVSDVRNLCKKFGIAPPKEYRDLV